MPSGSPTSTPPRCAATRHPERGQFPPVVELLRETPEQVGPLLEQYGRVLAGLDDGRGTWRRLQVLNQLGVTCGTLQLV